MAVTASVPLLVIGDPETVSHDGTLIPTLVTVPPPLMAAHIPSPRQYVDELAPVPELRLVTGRFPLTPPLEELARLIGGRSGKTIDPRASAPVVPFGVRRN